MKILTGMMVIWANNKSILVLMVKKQLILDDGGDPMIFVNKMILAVAAMSFSVLFPLSSMNLVRFDIQEGVSKREFFDQVHRFSHAMRNRPKNPYGQARVFSATDRIICLGDIHGDINALSANLNKMRGLGLIDDQLRLSDGVSLVFLGDIIDRGTDSIGSLWLALKLQEVNGSRVIILQGNHEADDQYSKDKIAKVDRTLSSQLSERFGGCSEVEHQMVTGLFECLPQAFFVGGNTQDAKINFLQLCHAGPGVHHCVCNGIDVMVDVDVMHLLALTAQRHGGIDTFLTFECTVSPMNGFILNDFRRVDDEISDNPERHEHAFFIGQQKFKNILAQQSNERFFISGLLGGHQHTPGGVSRLVDGRFAPMTSEVADDIQQGSVYKLTANKMEYKSNGFAVLQFDEDRGLWSITPYCDESNVNPKQISSKFNLKEMVGEFSLNSGSESFSCRGGNSQEASLEGSSLDDIVVEMSDEKSEKESHLRRGSVIMQKNHVHEEESFGDMEESADGEE